MVRWRGSQKLHFQRTFPVEIAIDEKNTAKNTAKIVRRSQHCSYGHILSLPPNNY